MNVRVGMTTGGNIIPVACGPGASVDDVIQAAGLKCERGDQILHNGVAVKPTFQAKENALILLGKPIGGG